MWKDLHTDFRPLVPVLQSGRSDGTECHGKLARKMLIGGKCVHAGLDPDSGLHEMAVAGGGGSCYLSWSQIFCTRDVCVELPRLFSPSPSLSPSLSPRPVVTSGLGQFRGQESTRFKDWILKHVGESDVTRLGHFLLHFWNLISNLSGFGSDLNETANQFNESLDLLSNIFTMHHPDRAGVWILKIVLLLSCIGQPRK